MQELKQEYEMFVNSGELKFLFPELTGKWEKDERKFTQLHEQWSKAMEMDINLDDEDEL